MTKSGVIIGGTGFLGLRLTEHFSSKGHDLVISGRNKSKLLEIQKNSNEKHKTKITTIDLDLENLTESVLRNKFDHSVDKIKFLIIASGSQFPIRAALKTKLDDWQKGIEVNLMGPIQVINYFAKKMVNQNQGSIIIFSGGGATSPRPNFSAYSTAKTGLIRYVENLAKELEQTNVKINAVSPGVMPSQMMNEVLLSELEAENIEKRKANSALLGNNFIFDNVLNLCDFLISDSSKGISGKLISADWDKWIDWPEKIDQISGTDLFTLRRIVGKDRSQDWADR